MRRSVAVELLGVGALSLFVSGCGGLVTGPIAPSTAFTIYGPDLQTGFGELTVSTTGTLLGSKTFGVAGLMPTGPILQGAAVDGGGNFYVSLQNTGTNPTGAVLMFASNAVPGDPPVRTVTGSLTQIGTPRDLTVDAAGNLYVAQIAGDVLEFGPGANGNVAPIRSLKGFPNKNTGILGANGMAVDSGGNLYLANSGSIGTLNGPTTVINDVLVFGPGQTGDVAPIRTIAGSNTMFQGGLVGVTLDAAGNIYTVTESTALEAILEFAAGANGNVVPIREISGSNTTMTGTSHVTNPVLDANGNVYVIVAAPGLVVNLVKFGANENGNAVPEAITPVGTVINSFEIAVH